MNDSMPELSDEGSERKERILALALRRGAMAAVSAIGAKWDGVGDGHVRRRGDVAGGGKKTGEA